MVSVVMFILKIGRLNAVIMSEGVYRVMDK